MCRHEHEHEHEHERGTRHGHHRGSGFRGFGRGGFPSREEWLERLQAHEQRLQDDLKNVQELIARLADPAAPGGRGRRLRTRPGVAELVHADDLSLVSSCGAPGYGARLTTSRRR